VEGEEGEMSREAKAFAMALGSMMKNDMDYFDKYPIDVSPLTRDEIDILKVLGEWTEEASMSEVFCENCRYYGEAYSSEFNAIGPNYWNWCSAPAHNYKVIKREKNYAGCHQWTEERSITPCVANQNNDCGSFAEKRWWQGRLR
jgi:hypothetical protein